MLHLACTLERAPRPDQRRFDRTETNRPVSIRSRENGRESGTVHNLSVGGCAISARGYFPLGSRVFVTIPNFSPFGGRVAWQDNGRIGIEFEVALHPAVVDHIARL